MSSTVVEGVSKVDNNVLQLIKPYWNKEQSRCYGLLLL